MQGELSRPTNLASKHHLHVEQRLGLKLGLVGGVGFTNNTSSLSLTPLDVYKCNLGVEAGKGARDGGTNKHCTWGVSSAALSSLHSWRRQVDQNWKLSLITLSMGSRPSRSHSLLATWYAPAPSTMLDENTCAMQLWLVSTKGHLGCSTACVCCRLRCRSATMAGCAAFEEPSRRAWEKGGRGGTHQ